MKARTTIKACSHPLRTTIIAQLLTISGIIIASVPVWHGAQPALAAMLRFNYEVQGFANEDGLTGGVLSFQVQGTVRDLFPRNQTLDITDYRATFRSDMETITHGIDDLLSSSAIDFRLEPGERPNDVSVSFIVLSSRRDNVDFFLLDPGEGFFSSVIVNDSVIVDDTRDFRGCDPLYGPACDVRRTVQRVPLEI